MLECSQKDATSSVSNSNWVSTFQSDQIIETGDTLSMKQCLINTQAINSQNIVLDKEETVTIEFCVYENTLPKGAIPFQEEQISEAKSQQTNEELYRSSFDYSGTHQSDLDTMKGYYLLRDGPNETDNLLTYTVNIPLKAGSYSPESLAGVITGGLKKFQSGNNLGTAVVPEWEPKVFNLPNNPVSFPAAAVNINFDMTIKTSTNHGYVVGDQVTFSDAENDATGATSATFDKDFFNGTHTVKAVPSATTFTIEGGPINGTSFQFAGEAGGASIKAVKVATVNFVAADYDNATVKNFGMKSVVLVNNSGDDLGQKGDTIRLSGSTDSLFECKNTAFQFSYLHTPVFTQMTKGPSGDFQIYSQPGVSVTAGELNADSNTAKVVAKFPPNVFDSYGGVLLTKLGPTSFWNDLGFSNQQLADIIFVDQAFKLLNANDGKDYIRSRTTGVNVASAFCRSDFMSTPFLQVIPRTGNGTYPLAVPVATSDMRPIIAKLPYTVDNIGFFRIEAITALSNEYNTPNERKSKVTAVVSKNYNTNDFITGYGGDSSLDYEHVGEPTVLNNIRIRIVDPLSETEVENLGPNSTVFMELVKAPPQQKSNVKHK